MEKLKARLPEKRRKDAVLAIEYFIGCSPDAFASNEDYKAYFVDALGWLRERHGKENVIASSLHFDETTPHMVAYVVPLDESGKLNAKKFLGGRQTLSSMQSDFAKKVGEKHGLDRGIERSTARHTSIKEWYGAMNQSVAPIEIPAIAVAPKVTKKRFLRDELETPEQIAKRLSGGVNKIIKPVLARSAVADIEKKRSLELQETIKRVQRELDKAKERARVAEVNAANLREVFQALTPAEQKALTEQARKNMKIRKRCEKIMTELYDHATAPVRRFVAKAKTILSGVAGKWWEINWTHFDREYLRAEAALSSELEAVKVLLDHSPGKALLSKAERMLQISAAEKVDLQRQGQHQKADSAQRAPSGVMAWQRPRQKG